MTTPSFPTPIETVRGSHYEMGLGHGRAYRHVIVANVQKFALRHDFQGAEEEIDAGLESARAGDEAFVPWVFEELRGIADGCGVPLVLIERLHLRVWSRVPRSGLMAGGGCTGIGMMAGTDGVLVGGTLDDPRQSYILIRRVPRDGIPHVMVNWAGAGWGHNGMNAAGLCIAQSSLGGIVPPLPAEDSGVRLRSSMASRALLEQCEDVPRAIDLIKRLRGTESLVIGDAKGNLVACQSHGQLLQAFQIPAEHENLVFNTNHIHMPELVQSVVAHGCVPKLTEYSLTRFAKLERARASMPRTVETIQRLLRSHDGYPHCICNDGTAFATYALPRSKPGVLFVADSPPCRNEFFACPIEEGGR